MRQIKMGDPIAILELMMLLLKSYIICKKVSDLSHGNGRVCEFLILTNTSQVNILHRIPVHVRMHNVIVHCNKLNLPYLL